MSIAVSAIVVPSRRLRALVALFGLSNLVAALVVGVALADHYTLAPLCTGFFLVAAVCMMHSVARAAKTLRIDVSGPGQLRLTVQQELRSNAAGEAPAAIPVSLLAGSTVWPQLMVLLLRSEQGALTVLPILRDSLAPQQFRALAVAVRAGRGRDTGLP
jgi:toxin CptA